MGKVARDALFLARFQAVRLPYADIASGVLVGLVVVVYLRIGERIPLRRLLINSQIFFAINCAFFWFLAVRLHPTWLYPTLGRHLWCSGAYASLDTCEFSAHHSRSKTHFWDGRGRSNLRVDFRRLSVENPRRDLRHREPALRDGASTSLLLPIDGYCLEGRKACAGCLVGIRDGNRRNRPKRLAR
jgi:hypothetical protein